MMSKHAAWFAAAILIGCGGSAHHTTARTAQTEITSARVPAPPARHVETFTSRTGHIRDAEEAPKPPPGPQTIAEWKKRYPDAAQDLHAWAQRHPRLADRMKAWEKQDPEKPRALVEWSITHSYEGVGAFLMQRQGWDDLRDIREIDPQGVDELLEWTRRSPNAAYELVTRSHGVQTASSL